MTKKHTQVEINVPFSGFYHSAYSELIDSAIENDADYFSGQGYCKSWEGQEAVYNETWPKELRIDSCDYSECISDAMDYADAQRQIAEKYIDAFEESLLEAIGRELYDLRKSPSRFTFEYHVKANMSLTVIDSPKYYNFRTNRLFANIDYRVLRLMFKLSAKEKHVRLAKYLKENMTARDGFIPHYSNDIEEWLEKPFSEWDYNEFGMLIAALFGDLVDDLRLFYSVAESVYPSEFIDWVKLPESILALRAKAFDSWFDEDETKERACLWAIENESLFNLIYPEITEQAAFLDYRDDMLETRPMRCDKTIDMFQTVSV